MRPSRTFVAGAIAAGLTVGLSVVVALVAAHEPLEPRRGQPVGTRSPAPAPSPSMQAFDNGEPCPRASGTGVPATAGCLSEVRADLDGDGRGDRFLVYALLDHGAMPRSWFARAVLSATEPTPAVAVPTGQGAAFVYPRVISAVDANRDGRAEAVVKLSAIIYHVGGQRIDGMFGVEEGRLRPVTVASGGRLEFRTGGIGPYGNGAFCVPAPDAPRFVVRYIRRVPSGHWGWTEWVYRWRGLTLVQVEVRRGSLPGSLSPYDPPVRPFYQLRCGPLLTS